MIWDFNMGGRGWSEYNLMVEKCGYLEVLRDFFLKFSTEIWFHTYIGTESRDLANLYPLCVYMYTYISFGVLGAIWWLKYTYIDTVKN